jgi:hypothetical protein
MHERHYLRVASEQMHDAILTLYRHDPISNRQRELEPLRPAAAGASAGTQGWLEQDADRLTQLEAQLGLKAS